MNREQVEEQFKKVLEGFVPSSLNIEFDKSLFDEYGFDSLDCFEFLIEVENSFEVELSDAVFCSQNTINGMIDHLFETLQAIQ